MTERTLRKLRRQAQLQLLQERVSPSGDAAAGSAPPLDPGMGVSGGPVRVQRDSAEEIQEEGAAGGVRTDTGTGATAAGAESGDDGPQVADPRGGVDIDLNLDWE